MDAATYAAVQLNRHRAAELDREIAHLGSQAERRAALGDLAPQPLRRSVWTRLTLRRGAKQRRTSAGFALAGPPS
jgi:hypothetical protein